MIQIEDKTFEDIIRALSTDRRAFAIKIVAKCLDISLKDAREYIEAL